jgi:lysophospholipase L1-like esterase
MDRIVLPYKPRVIVYYCGSNDVNAGESAAAIASRYEAFSERVQRSLPATRLYFASIIRAPQKRDRWDVVDDANARIREYSARTPGRGYIDLNPALEAAVRQPRMDLYLPDGLHYLPPAYDRIAAVIKPVITAAWTELSSDGASRRE